MEDKGRIGHAELQIGDSHIMLADEHPEMKIVVRERLADREWAYWSTFPTWTACSSRRWTRARRSIAA